MRETSRGRRVEAGLWLLCSADARRARGTRIDENNQHKTSARVLRATLVFFRNPLFEGRFGRARDALTRMVHLVLTCVLMCVLMCKVHVLAPVRVPRGLGRHRVATACMVI